MAGPTGPTGATGPGGGLVTYAATSLALSGGAAPLYLPFGGDGGGSATEANVQTLIQPVLITTNACINLSAAPGTGHTLVVVLNDNGSPTGITMNVSGANTSACDVAHTWTNT